MILQLNVTRILELKTFKSVKCLFHFSFFYFLPKGFKSDIHLLKLNYALIMNNHFATKIEAYPFIDPTYSEISAPFFVPLLLANLTCLVVNDGAGGNPGYCSVFANGYNENGGDQNGNSLCQSAEPHNDDIIPEYLKDVVKLEDDGM